MDAPEEPLPPVIYTMENKPIVTCECPAAREGAAAAAGSPARVPDPSAPAARPRSPGPVASWNGGVAGAAAAAAAGPLNPQATFDLSGADLRPQRGRPPGLSRCRWTAPVTRCARHGGRAPSGRRPGSSPRARGPS